MSPSKDFELALIKINSKYAPTGLSNPRLNLFYDYLTSMEAFIEAEIQKYGKEFETTGEKFKSGEIPTPPDLDFMPDELQEISYFSEQVKDFAQVLRRSFFVNLYAYVETYMLEQYKESGGKEKLGRQIIVEAARFITKKGHVEVNKIPHWNDINCHIEIRNRFTHADGRIPMEEGTTKGEKKDTKSENIRKYARGKPIKIEYGQIILQKGFCEHTLEVVENFLNSVERISKELKQSTQ